MAAGLRFINNDDGGVSRGIKVTPKLVHNIGPKSDNSGTFKIQIVMKLFAKIPTFVPFVNNLTPFLNNVTPFEANLAPCV